MVNYDTQDGYSVTSFQSPVPEQLIKSSISSSSRLNALETLEEASSLELLPSSYTASDLVHHNVGNNQHHHNVHTNGLLVPSTSILSIREVHFKHAGNYTCSPSNARNGTITIHVLRGNILFLFFTCNIPRQTILTFKLKTLLVLPIIVVIRSTIMHRLFTTIHFILSLSLYSLYKSLKNKLLQYSFLIKRCRLGSFNAHEYIILSFIRCLLVNVSVFFQV